MNATFLKKPKVSLNSGLSPNYETKACVFGGTFPLLPVPLRFPFRVGPFEGGPVVSLFTCIHLPRGSIWRKEIARQSLWKDVYASFPNRGSNHCNYLYDCGSSHFLVWNPKKSWWKLRILVIEKNVYKVSKTISAVSPFPWSPSKKNTGPRARSWQSILYKAFFSTSLLSLSLCFSSPDQV